MPSHLEACSIATEAHLQTRRISVVPGSELWGLSEQGPSCEKLVDSQSIVATMVRYQLDMIEDIR